MLRALFLGPGFRIVFKHITSLDPRSSCFFLHLFTFCEIQKIFFQIFLTCLRILAQKYAYLYNALFRPEISLVEFLKKEALLRARKATGFLAPIEVPESLYVAEGREVESASMWPSRPKNFCIKFVCDNMYWRNLIFKVSMSKTTDAPERWTPLLPQLKRKWSGDRFDRGRRRFNPRGGDADPPGPWWVDLTSLQVSCFFLEGRTVPAYGEKVVGRIRVGGWIPREPTQPFGGGGTPGLFRSCWRRHFFPLKIFPFVFLFWALFHLLVATLTTPWIETSLPIDGPSVSQFLGSGRVN